VSIGARVVLTLVGAPVAAFVGFLAAGPLIGWPHVMDGLLAHASDLVRECVATAFVVGFVVAALWLIWRGALPRKIRGAPDRGR
jgi:hypothetical protein